MKTPDLIPWWMLFVIALVLFGCVVSFASAEPNARLITLQSVTGNMVPVMHFTEVRCPQEEFGGCAYFGWVTVNVDGLSSTDEHEAMHVAGGKHGEWMQRGNGDNCAMVTQQGRSNWAVGMLLCRRGDGSFYQVAP